MWINNELGRKSESISNYLYSLLIYFIKSLFSTLEITSLGCSKGKTRAAISAKTEFENSKKFKTTTPQAKKFEKVKENRKLGVEPMSHSS